MLGADIVHSSAPERARAKRGAKANCKEGSDEACRKEVGKFLPSVRPLSKYR
jgi:hypothetical protein